MKPASVFPVLALLASPLLVASCNSSGERLERSPEDALALYKDTASVHYAENDLNRAESQALKGLAIEPEDVPLRLMVAWIRLRRGSTDDLLLAEGIFRSLEDEDDYRAWIGLANTLERLGVAYQEAAEGVRSGERYTDATDPEKRADELAGEAREHWEEAITLLERTLTERPDNINAMQGMQRLHALCDRPQEALFWSAELLDVSRRELAAWREQLEREDLTDEDALRWREREAQEVDVQVSTHLFAAAVLHEEHKPAEALAHLDEVVALDPDRSETYARRAVHLHELGRNREAIENLNRFLGLTELPLDHPDVDRAFALRTRCEDELFEVAAQEG